MAENRQREPLLGRLAALGWFTQNGGVAATQAVAMLLEQPQLRDALLRRLAQITETELAWVALHFQAELVHDDLARPDLEGRDSRGRPLVVIEAKFGGRLTTAQLRAYLAYQVARLDAGVRGGLVVLVPSYRRPEAEAVLSTVGNEARERSASTPSVATAVLTWDLRQLRALCKRMAALDVAPLGWSPQETPDGKSGKLIYSDSSTRLPRVSGLPAAGCFPLASNQNSTTTVATSQAASRWATRDTT
jgi:hypothetical protein